MNLIELKNISKSYFSQNLYKNVNLEINKGEKIALIGNNGVGKTTFLKLLLEIERANHGTIDKVENIKISYLEQHNIINDDTIVSNLLNEPFEHIIKVQSEMDEIGKQFTGIAKEDEITMKKYIKLSDEFDSLGGFSYLQKQAEFISIFGLNDKLNKVFKELSGGEKQYIRLALTLFSENDIIILDEPLSFFDKKRIKWLINYINESDKTFIIISHNINFITGFATKIFDIDNNTIESYMGGYETYIKEKKVRIADKKRQNNETEEEIQKLQSAIEKKLKILERCNNKHAHAIILKRMRKEIARLQKKRIKFSNNGNYNYLTTPEEAIFTKKHNFIAPIIIMNNITKMYDDVLLYKDVNFIMQSDTKICVVGENGSGKSTLLKIISGLENPTSGEINMDKRLKIAYIKQESKIQDENLYLTEFLKIKTGLSDEFLELAIDNLYNDEVNFKDKRVFMLSGGEKKRLEIFANILIESDVLIIDEPSTYMDEHSRTNIANMLLDYTGAVILVTHDKALMKKLNFDIYDIRDNRFRIKSIQQ